MIQITLTIIVFALLFIISLIDLKTKKVPAFLTTGIIFVVAMVNMANIEFGLIHLGFGVLAFIFAYLLYETDFIGGVADIKVIVIIGMMIISIPYFFLAMILIMLFGIGYKFLLRYGLKKPEGSEIPFIISLWAVYTVLWAVGGLI